MRASIRVMAMVALTSLACSGAGTSSPDPEPKPKPRPKPAGNAKDCANFFGVSLPKTGGVITKCTKTKVTVNHGDDASEAKWTYADAYVAKGWSRGDPNKGNASVSKGAKQLVFSSSGENVQIAKK